MGNLNNQTALNRITSEVADRLRQSLLADQPVTTKLIVSNLVDYLKNEDAVADMARRALMGENVFGKLVRKLIQDEAEEIAKAAVAGQLEVA